MNYKKTGELIASARKERGLTQKGLAEELHVSDRTVSKWERGVGFPDVSLLEPLSRSLNLSISEIVLGEKNGETTHISDERIIKEALAILKREIAQQLRKKIILTSITVAFPFLISILFWSRIPDEIGILVGTNSPYTPKLFVFTAPPFVLLLANALHIARINGKMDMPKMSHGFSLQFPLIDAPTNTLTGKLYAVFKQVLYWIVPIISFHMAALTYIAAFRT